MVCSIDRHRARMRRERFKIFMGLAVAFGFIIYVGIRSFL